MDPKQVVRDGYDRIWRAYESWSPPGAGGLRHRYIDRALQAARPDAASALDLGCGSGRHATARLIERGLDVTGLDISPRSIAAAAAALPGGRFVVGDMSAAPFAPESFDLVTALYSLIHVPKEEHASLLARIGTWLRPGGVLLATAAPGERPFTDIDDRWLGLAPMYWSGWDAATTIRLVRDAGLDIVEATPETEDEDGRPVTFLWIVARRPRGGCPPTPTRRC